MARIINLRQARKARDRDARRAEGGANAARHGRTKAQKQAEDAAKTRAKEHLEGHKRDE